MNTALCPTGSPESVAVRLLIASPSGSPTPTTSDSGLPSPTEVIDKAVTTGARSTLETAMVVVAGVVSVFAAENVTEYGPGASA